MRSRIDVLKEMTLGRDVWKMGKIEKIGRGDAKMRIELNCTERAHTDTDADTDTGTGTDTMT
jgi:hypothetical protein